MIFVGDDTQYYVRLEGGQLLMVREQNHSPLEAAALPQVGQPVTVEWSSVSTTLLLE